MFFLLNFSDVIGLKSPFRAPSAFLKCQFFLKLPFKDIHCQLSGKINIVQKKVFCCFKTLIRNDFCHSFSRGGRGSYEDQLVILVYVILGGRGGGVELKMHDVILFAVFFF